MALLLIQTLSHANGQVLVAVGNTGVGLKPDARGRIFDAFYTTKPGGSAWSCRSAD